MDNLVIKIGILEVVMGHEQVFSINFEDSEPSFIKKLVMGIRNQKDLNYYIRISWIEPILVVLHDLEISGSVVKKLKVLTRIWVVF